MATHAELTALATSLRELTARVTAITEELATDERDDLGPELFEVERALKGALRRLERIVG